MFKQSLDVMRKMMEERQEEFKKIKEMVEEVKRTDFYYRSYDKAMNKLIEALEKLMDEIAYVNLRLDKVEERQQYTSKEIIKLLAHPSKLEGEENKREEEGRVISRIITMLEKQNKALLYLSNRLISLERLMIEGDRKRAREGKRRESMEGIKDDKKNKRIASTKEGKEEKGKKGEEEVKADKKERIKEEVVNLLKNIVKKGEKVYVGEIYENYFKNKIKRYEFYDMMRKMETKGDIKSEKKGTKKYVYI